MNDIAVIGAGPMGLTAAWKLARAGHEVTVFEADSVPGGMSASFDFDGILMERYYHFINLPDQTLFNLLDELGLADELRWANTKMGFFREDSDGERRLHPWGNPAALLALADISLFTRLRYGFHAWQCKFIRNLKKLDNVSAREWISSWEGSAGYDLLWKFLFEKKFFQLAEPLSAAWIASRIRRVANSRENIMREKLGYLEGGSQRLMDRLSEEILHHGGTISLSTPVRRIARQSGNLVVETDQGASNFKKIVSTIPLQYLPNLVDNLPALYRTHILAMKNVGCACALFRLSKKLTENFWLNVDIPEWDVPGVIEYSNLRPMDKAYVYVPFYMPQNHPNWSKDDGELLDIARKTLEGINPEAAASEENAMLFRYEYAQPVCKPGFGEILPSYATGIPGFYAADTAHSYPEDRSINESARIGQELAALAMKDF